MNYYVIIPTHNEEKFLSHHLDALLQQTLLPKKIVVVNDNSTDGTEKIIDGFSKKHPQILKVNTKSTDEHLPGSKIINAFYKGFEVLDDNFDAIVKLDADILLPQHYFETISKTFKENPKIGMCGGVCYIEKNGKWIYENIADKDHLRGPIKTYTKPCFEAIGGLKNSIGWDTVDELLAKYHGFEVKTIASLQVKHLRPTGKSYQKQKSKYVQGEALYKMRYGFLLAFIASAKMALNKKNMRAMMYNLKGYFNAKNKKLPFLVSKKEGRFIRTYRWKGILAKLLLFKK